MTYGSLTRIAFVVGVATMLPAQQAKKPGPMQTQSPSTVALTVKDGEEAVEITNVAYHLTGSGIPGLPGEQRLLLKTSSHTKELVDSIGMEASTTTQAWPLGVDLKQKPLYSLTVAGIDPRVINNEVLVISRGLEEVEWWSVYKLGSAAHLFDTYTPLVQFSVGTETQELRYVGFEVPGDDITDPRLRAQTVVGVLTYSSGDHVMREALITCDKRELATFLRSFADATRRVSLVERRLPTGITRSIAIVIFPNDPSARGTYTITIPIVKDDFDLAHTTGSVGIHAAAWKR